MHLRILNEPFPHLIINDVYTDLEQKLIWEELQFLSSKMLPPEMTATAKDHFGRVKKRGSGIFLEGVYNSPEISTLYQTSNKLFMPSIMERVVDPANHILFRSFKHISGKRIYAQMYKNGDYYDAHDDVSFFTAITLFHKIPKQYTGGDLGFSEYDYIPELSHNSAIFFPSCLDHYVSEVKLSSNETENARFTITQFLSLG